MGNVAAIAGFTGALAFGILAALLFGSHRSSLVGKLLLTACVASALWLAAIGAYYGEVADWLPVSAISVLEVVRNAAWFLFVTAILFHSREAAFHKRLKLLGLIAAGVSLAAIAITLTPVLSLFRFVGPQDVNEIGFVLFLSMAIIGLLYTEQLFRNTHPDTRWGIKHLCIALLGIFAYDIYLYAEAVLFKHIAEDAWEARGFANALAVPLIALSANRNREWDVSVFVSRHVVFHSTAIMAVGIYLLLMAAAGFYLQSVGGSWGGALRAIFVFGAVLFLLTVVLSRQIRSKLRLFLAKHFYQNKYDYGDVWLNLTDTLSKHDGRTQTLYEVTVKAIADILDSTGGMLWHRDQDGNFVLAAEWLMTCDQPAMLSANARLIQTLSESKQTIDVPYTLATMDAENNILPKFLMDMPRAWLIVPIFHGDELLAFVILADSRSNESLSWEDRDLLKTVSHQAGSYIALLRTTDSLSELKQFEAFNQMSAFLVHDLKNVVAQLSLIVRNSEKHRHNPEFVEDAFTTVGDAVDKMNRMLGNLKHGLSVRQTDDRFEVNQVVNDSTGRCNERLPVPTLVPCPEKLAVSGDSTAIASVVEHLIQNAQDATGNDGQVNVVVKRDADQALIQIADNGIGMDPQFIQTRLFKPFDTTKGKAGMGIGVYESRHLVTQMGGRLSVQSEPGIGTTFTIALPCVESVAIEQTRDALGESVSLNKS